MKDYFISKIRNLIERYLEGYLQSTNNRPPINVEISPLSCSLSELYDYMGDYGYQAYNIYNTDIKINIRILDECTDVMFLAMY